MATRQEEPQPPTGRFAFDYVSGQTRACRGGASRLWQGQRVGPRGVGMLPYWVHTHTISNTERWGRLPLWSDVDLQMWMLPRQEAARQEWLYRKWCVTGSEALVVYLGWWSSSWYMSALWPSRRAQLFVTPASIDSSILMLGLIPSDQTWCVLFHPLCPACQLLLFDFCFINNSVPRWNIQDPGNLRIGGVRLPLVRSVLNLISRETWEWLPRYLWNRAGRSVTPCAVIWSESIRENIEFSLLPHFSNLFKRFLILDKFPDWYMFFKGHNNRRIIYLGSPVVR